LKLGRLHNQELGPGLIWINPCTDTLETVDIRAQVLDVPPQQILTKDSVTVMVDAVVHYRHMDPIQAAVAVENRLYSTSLLAQTTLREIISSLNMNNVFSDKNAIEYNVMQIIDKATDPWGIKVERLEIKSVNLPHQLQRAMAAAAEATNEAKAKMIAADGELTAAKALAEAADVINKTPGGIQLRYLQSLTNVAADKNSTVIFPLPAEYFKKL